MALTEKDLQAANEEFRATGVYKFIEKFNEVFLGGILRAVLAIVNALTKK